MSMQEVTQESKEKPVKSIRPKKNKNLLFHNDTQQEVTRSLQSMDVLLNHKESNTPNLEFNLDGDANLEVIYSNLDGFLEKEKNQFESVSSIN